MPIYLILNLFIIAGPLFALAYPKFNLKLNFKSLLRSIVWVSTPFIVWDCIFTALRIWHFNPRYLLGLKVFNLPIEEIFFFFTIPFACLTLYEFSQKITTFNNPVNLKFRIWIMVILSLVVSIFNTDKLYTLVVFLLSAFLFLYINLPRSKKNITLAYFIYLGFSFLGFLIINSLLTSLPIVSYNPSAILGIRLGTIPIEDFVYNLILLTAYLWVYKHPLDSTK